MRDIVDEMKKNGQLGDLDLKSLFVEKKNKKTDTMDIEYDNTRFIVTGNYMESPTKSDPEEVRNVRPEDAVANPELKNRLRE
jgi:hypothetical protein